MIGAVLLFALLTGVFEFMLLAKMSPRVRLRILNYPGAITFVFFALNLMVHWGTVTGTMTAIVAALVSGVTTVFARAIWGYIHRDAQGRLIYEHGFVMFDANVVR